MVGANFQSGSHGSRLGWLEARPLGFAQPPGSDLGPCDLRSLPGIPLRRWRHGLNVDPRMTHGVTILGRALLILGRDDLAASVGNARDFVVAELPGDIF